MKRTLPLILTAVFGAIMIVAFFVPAWQWLGEFTAIAFDILASIAFILGGGNLLKIHLKKMSDRSRGWGYSAVTILAFSVMLAFGLFKIGTRPAAKQEHYGAVFARLDVADFPAGQATRIDGRLPRKANGERLPASVRRLLTEENGQLVFRTWMTPDQKTDLLQYENTLEWRCTIEKLAKAARPPKKLQGKVTYFADHSALAFNGAMNDAQQAALLKLAKPDNAAWKTAVETLHESSNEEHSIALDKLPQGVTENELGNRVKFDAASGTLSIRGPMSPGTRDELAKKPFPLSHPLQGKARAEFLKELEARGEAPLTKEQLTAFDKALDGGWSAEQLIKTLDGAGKVPEKDKSACEMLEEKQSGVAILKPRKMEGFETRLSDGHKRAIRKFASTPSMTLDELIEELKAVDQRRLAEAMAAGGLGGFVIRATELQDSLFVARQEAALKKFVSNIPTRGERNARLAVALLREGPLTERQRSLLTDEYRREQQWRETLGKLFVAAHTAKYPWSGEYRQTGSPFWWMYEYAFKPLTATMFAMLAFYVASAAFRAFRAKNVEAGLLLGTAFLILLGRTFAGVLLTSWIPENSPFAGLRIEHLTVYIMKVFNTAGNRAIMIGIALGIAATSLKVLLGVDRSYLGSQED